MKGKVLVIVTASVLAFPVLAAGSGGQPSGRNAVPSWHWDPDVVGEKYIYRDRTQTTNEFEEQNRAKATDQNRFRENNADTEQQFKSQESEPNGIGW